MSDELYFSDADQARMLLARNEELRTENATLRARVEELERQRPAANRAEHCTVEREDGRICGGSIEVDEDGDIACEFCRSRAHIAKLAAACSAKDEALAEIQKVMDTDGMNKTDRLDAIDAALLRARGVA